MTNGGYRGAARLASEEFESCKHRHPERSEAESKDPAE
jgi:hypothetical protein